MASLSTCHLELVVWDGNLVKSCLLKILKDVIFIVMTFSKLNIHGLFPGIAIGLGLWSCCQHVAMMFEPAIFWPYLI